MIRYHALPDEVLRELMFGGGGEHGVQMLQQVERSTRLLLIRYLIASCSDEMARSEVSHALVTASARAPRQFEAFLSEPVIAAKLVETAQSVGREGPEIELRLISDLRAIAIAAVWRCGVAVDLPIYPRNNALILPSVGRTRVASADDFAIAVSVRSGNICINDASAAEWCGVRHLHTVSDQIDLCLAVDDVTYSGWGQHDMGVADRLSPEELHLWQERLDQAWQLLVCYARGYALELSKGLRTLIPLRSPTSGYQQSATSRFAFGMLASTTPLTPEDFAISLVHEFQHSKLTVLLKLVKLFEVDQRVRYFVPWRADPRPIEAVLQGIYAFLGVAHTWRRFTADEALCFKAQEQLLATSSNLEIALQACENSRELSADGKLFVKRVRGSLKTLI